MLNQQNQSMTDGQWTKCSLCGALLCWCHKNYSVVTKQDAFMIPDNLMELRITVWINKASPCLCFVASLKYHTNGYNKVTISTRQICFHTMCAATVDVVVQREMLYVRVFNFRWIAMPNNMSSTTYKSYHPLFSSICSFRYRNYIMIFCLLK